jgi:hypothetical protein
MKCILFTDMVHTDTGPNPVGNTLTIDSRIGLRTEPTTPIVHKAVTEKQPKTFNAFAASKNEEVNRLQAVLNQTASVLEYERAKTWSNKSSFNALSNDAASSSTDSKTTAVSTAPGLTGCHQPSVAIGTRQCVQGVPLTTSGVRIQSRSSLAPNVTCRYRGQTASAPCH